MKPAKVFIYTLICFFSLSFITLAGVFIYSEFFFSRALVNDICPSLHVGQNIKADSVIDFFRVNRIEDEQIYVSAGTDQKIYPLSSPSAVQLLRDAALGARVKIIAIVGRFTKRSCEVKLESEHIVF